MGRDNSIEFSARNSTVGITPARYDERTKRVNDHAADDASHLAESQLTIEGRGKIGLASSSLMLSLSVTAD